jgi:RNA polymerase sigma-70 factor, ECF subfamily
MVRMPVLSPVIACSSATPAGNLGRPRSLVGSSRGLSDSNKRWFGAGLQKRRERFDSLFREYSGQVLGFALNRGLSLDEAEDVVSDTFLVCWRRLDDLPQSELPWLLGTARKTIANHRRSDRRRGGLSQRVGNMLLSEPRETDGPAEAIIRRTEIKAALDELSDGDREAIMLVEWDGLRYADAARVVGCSHAAFSVRLHRARNRLRKYLTPTRTYQQLDPSDSGMETP